MPPSTNWGLQSSLGQWVGIRYIQQLTIGYKVGDAIPYLTDSPSLRRQWTELEAMGHKVEFETALGVPLQLAQIKT